MIESNQSPTAFGTGPTILDGDYEAIKVETDTINNKLTVTIKETQRETTSSDNMNRHKDRLRGELHCTCSAHATAMQTYSMLVTVDWWKWNKR